MHSTTMVRAACLRAAVAALAAGLALAACGGGGADAPAAAATTTGTSATTVAGVSATASAGAATGTGTAVTTAAGATTTGTTSGATTGATTVTAAITTTATTATVTAVATRPALSAAAAAVLNLDIGNLFNYAAPALPAYYDAGVAATDNTPANNAASNAIATLGRVLFYDKQLSINNTISCASCHQQVLGFSDGNKFSVGFSGAVFGTAHAMRLANVRYYQPGSMFWDRRSATLEAQASQPIQNLVEMGFDATHGGIAALLAKLPTIAYYPELFTFAFGDSTITEARLQRALAQFERSMVSTGSRWDQGFALNFNRALPDTGLDLPIAAFTVQENRGRHLFMAGANGGGLNCAACHVPPTFALAANARSNGLDANETILFKAPSLKNVALAANFMHDGRFSTLDQVIEHYNSGVMDGPALDNRLKGGNGAARPLNLPADDKAALVAFLRTLSDTALAADAKFTTPFKP